MRNSPWSVCAYGPNMATDMVLKYVCKWYNELDEGSSKTVVREMKDSKTIQGASPCINRIQPTHIVLKTLLLRFSI